MEEQTTPENELDSMSAASVSNNTTVAVERNDATAENSSAVGSNSASASASSPAGGSGGGGALEAEEAVSSSPNTSASASFESFLKNVEHLAQLKASGILSEQEFSMAKSAALAAFSSSSSSSQHGRNNITTGGGGGGDNGNGDDEKNTNNNGIMEETNSSSKRRNKSTKKQQTKATKNKKRQQQISSPLSATNNTTNNNDKRTMMGSGGSPSAAAAGHQPQQSCHHRAPIIKKKLLVAAASPSSFSGPPSSSFSGGGGAAVAAIAINHQLQRNLSASFSPKKIAGGGDSRGGLLTGVVGAAGGAASGGTTITRHGGGRRQKSSKQTKRGGWRNDDEEEDVRSNGVDVAAAAAADVNVVDIDDDTRDQVMEEGALVEPDGILADEQLDDGSIFSGGGGLVGGIVSSPTRLNTIGGGGGVGGTSNDNSATSFLRRRFSTTVSSSSTSTTPSVVMETLQRHRSGVLLHKHQHSSNNNNKKKNEEFAVPHRAALWSVGGSGTGAGSGGGSGGVSLKGTPPLNVTYVSSTGQPAGAGGAAPLTTSVTVTREAENGSDDKGGDADDSDRNLIHGLTKSKTTVNNNNNKLVNYGSLDDGCVDGGNSKQKQQRHTNKMKSSAATRASAAAAVTIDPPSPHTTVATPSSMSASASKSSSTTTLNLLSVGGHHQHGTNTAINGGFINKAMISPVPSFQNLNDTNSKIISSNEESSSVPAPVPTTTASSASVQKPSQHQHHEFTSSHEQQKQQQQHQQQHYALLPSNVVNVRYFRHDGVSSTDRNDVLGDFLNEKHRRRTTNSDFDDDDDTSTQAMVTTSGNDEWTGSDSGSGSDIYSGDHSEDHDFHVEDGGDTRHDEFTDSELDHHLHRHNHRRRGHHHLASRRRRYHKKNPSRTIGDGSGIGSGSGVFSSKVSYEWCWVDIVGRDEENGWAQFNAVLNDLTTAFDLCPSLLVDMDFNLIQPQIIEAASNTYQYLVVLRAANAQIHVEDDADSVTTNRWILIIDTRAKVVMTLHRYDAMEFAVLRSNWSYLMGRGQQPQPPQHVLQDPQKKGTSGGSSRETGGTPPAAYRQQQQQQQQQQSRIGFQDFLSKLFHDAVGTYETPIVVDNLLLELCEGILFAQGGSQSVRGGHYAYTLSHYLSDESSKIRAMEERFLFLPSSHGGGSGAESIVRNIVKRLSRLHAVHVQEHKKKKLHGYYYAWKESLINLLCFFRLSSNVDTLYDHHHHQNSHSYGPGSGRSSGHHATTSYRLERATKQVTLRLPKETSKEDMNLLLYHLHRRANVFHSMLLRTYKVLKVANAEFGVCSEDRAEQMAAFPRELSVKAHESKDDASRLLEVHLNLVSFRTNELMKTLTILSIFFTPLSFLTGFFGMNFEHMTLIENHKNGFIYGCMLFFSVLFTQFVYFRIRGIV